MRFLKICDVITNREIVDKDKSDYNKGFKTLEQCEFIEYSEKVYKIIDVDFIKSIDYSEKTPFVDITFKDGSNFSMDKIHLEEIFLKWSEE